MYFFPGLLSGFKMAGFSRWHFSILFFPSADIPGI